MAFVTGHPDVGKSHFGHLPGDIMAELRVESDLS